MNWKIWRKSAHEDIQKTGGATTIPEPVARYMVVDLQEEAEWVWYLKAVLSPRPESKHVYDFRVFEAAKAMAKNVQVQNFASLDNHPELIVLQGSYHRKSGDVWAEPGAGMRGRKAA
jgi:hypothetical protein